LHVLEKTIVDPPERSYWYTPILVSPQLEPPLRSNFIQRLFERGREDWQTIHHL
jgi:hypothetical protein